MAARDRFIDHKKDASHQEYANPIIEITLPPGVTAAACGSFLRSVYTHEYYHTEPAHINQLLVLADQYAIPAMQSFYRGLSEAVLLGACPADSDGPSELEECAVRMGLGREAVQSSMMALKHRCPSDISIGSLLEHIKRSTTPPMGPSQSEDQIKLMTDDFFKDITFVTEDRQRLKAHKFLLTARSKYLHAMFTRSVPTITFLKGSERLLTRI